MKKSLILVLGVIVFNFLFFTLFTSRPPIEIKIDNPTDSNLILKIDDKPISIKKHTLRSFEIKPGRRKFEFDSMIQFKNIEYDNKYLINPTKGVYYLDGIKYYSEKPNTIHSSRTIDTVEIGGYQVDAPIKVTNDFIIKGDWSFWPHQYVPYTIQVKNKERTVGPVIGNRIKIYSQNEYHNLIKIQYGAYIMQAKEIGMSKESIKALLKINDEQFEQAKNAFSGK